MTPESARTGTPIAIAPARWRDGHRTTDVEQLDRGDDPARGPGGAGNGSPCGGSPRRRRSASTTRAPGHRLGSHVGDRAAPYHVVADRACVAGRVGEHPEGPSGSRSRAAASPLGRRSSKALRSIRLIARRAPDRSGHRPTLGVDHAAGGDHACRQSRPRPGRRLAGPGSPPAWPAPPRTGRPRPRPAPPADRRPPGTWRRSAGRPAAGRARRRGR